ncbi:MAG: hypothetical protein FD135_3628 [Comamonadaceae bacterium]|nr:MAG: hypothetical protein FD135_3628 [Comamonadaceae bacterium]
MKTYRITITLADGTQGRSLGLYSDGFAAVIDVMTTFPDAHRISARRMP